MKNIQRLNRHSDFDLKCESVHELPWTAKIRIDDVKKPFDTMLFFFVHLKILWIKTEMIPVNYRYPKGIGILRHFYKKRNIL